MIDEDPTSRRDCAGIRVVKAEELLGDRGVLQIELKGEIYQLRLTKNDRLILTK